MRWRFCETRREAGAWSFRIRGRRCGGARFGNRGAHFDHVAALAALHTHGLADDLLIVDLIFSFALIAEKLHADSLFAQKGRG